MNIVNFGFGTGYFNLDLFVRLNQLLFLYDSLLFEESSPDYDETKNEHTFLLPANEMYELIYFSSGKGEIIFDGRSYEIKPGVFFLKPPKTTAYERVFYCDHPMKHSLVFNIKSSSSIKLIKRQLTYKEEIEKIKNLYMKNEFQHGTVNNPESISSIINLIYEELLNEQFVTDIAVQQLLMYFFLNAFRCFKNDPQYYLMPAFSGKRQFVYYVRGLVKLECNTLTLDELAKRVNSSRRQLQRDFKSYFDCTFREYRDEYRILRAKTLIESGEKNPKTLFKQLGFSSLIRFEKSFLKFQGVTLDSFINNFHK